MEEENLMLADSRGGTPPRSRFHSRVNGTKKRRAASQLHHGAHFVKKIMAAHMDGVT